ncbi:thiol:disulfide interchange protein DsbG [Candidatus Symbiobacter mobilis CR]|uniref:Thiol:disulfide interchange protein DsbG n=1 Tax=Candidatus Symbiobacter mobilis CR TaxID=946483 RepID=U5NCN1_9BURK|nr:thiol:disulfide interchange protein DsbG [Candidatus Symbiobacter mobilis CR]
MDPPAIRVSQPASTPQVQSKPVREMLQSGARGFSLGSQIGRKTAYVFFDPQCGHCGHLWQAALPLQQRMHFVWVPVAFMSRKSLPQGVAILHAADPAAAMAKHEDALLSGSGGIDVALGQGNGQENDTAIQTLQEAIRANTALLEKLGVNSVPHLIIVDAESDATTSHSGAMPTPALAELLGVQP